MSTSNNLAARQFQSSFEQKWAKVLSFQAPKLVVIEDVYIGLFHRCLQLLFIIVIAVDLFNNEKYLSSKAVEGSLGLFASSGDLKAAQGREAADPNRLCKNPDYYFFSGSQLGKYAYSSCENQDYYEMHDKGENEFFMQTSLIESTTVTQDCTLAGSPQSCSVRPYEVWQALQGTTGAASASAEIMQRAECHCLTNTDKYRADFASAGAGTLTNDRCSCLGRRHIYTPGVEEMTVKIQPTMTVDWGDAVGMCSGRYTIAKPETEVHGVDGHDSSIVCPAGQTCSIPVRKLMSLVGIASLDDPVKESEGDAEEQSQMIDVNGYNQARYTAACNGSNPPSFCSNGLWTVEDQPPAGVDPLVRDAYNAKRRATYRQTGLALRIEIRFKHTCGDNSATAKVYVSNPGIVWNSKGSDVQYVEPKFPSNATRECTCGSAATAANQKCACPAFVDRYKFGLRAQFEITGDSRRVDPFYILSTVAEMFVFVLISSSIVSVVAFYLVPNKSKFYQTRRTEEVNIDIVNARLAAQTAIAALSFRGLDENGDGVISHQEFAELFVSSNPNISAAQAKEMANHILKVADRNQQGNISFTEFAKCIAEDPKSLDLMYRSVARPKFDAASHRGQSQRLPPPHHMWEERTTADGKKYYANHDTRTTTWFDPRHTSQQGYAQAPPQVIQMIGQQQMQAVAASQSGAQVVPQPQMVVMQQGAPNTQV